MIVRRLGLDGLPWLEGLGLTAKGSWPYGQGLRAWGWGPGAMGVGLRALRPSGMGHGPWALGIGLGLVKMILQILILVYR